MQERHETTIMEEYIQHNELDQWVINMFSFHNARLVREMLPRSLWSPIPLHQDRQTKHAEFARVLQQTRSARRAAQKARADAKRTTDAIQVEGEDGGGRSRKRQRQQADGQ